MCLALGFLAGTLFAGQAARKYGRQVACQELQDELLIHISSCGHSVILVEEFRICQGDLPNTPGQYLGCANQIKTLECDQPIPQECNTLRFNNVRQ